MRLTEKRWESTQLWGEINSPRADARANLCGRVLVSAHFLMVLRIADPGWGRLHLPDWKPRWFDWFSCGLSYLQPSNL